MYLDVAGHMVAFFGKKANSQAGLLHEEGIQASQAIVSIPTWMGYPATWRMWCVCISEASEIVTACKRLERENWRRAHWELQNQFSALQLNSMLSAAARPFQPQAVMPTASRLTLVAAPPHVPLGGPELGSPAVGTSRGSPIGRRPATTQYTTDDEGASMDTVTSARSCRRR